MRTTKQKVSGVLLLLGMVLLVVGMSTDNTAFSWAAVVCVLLSLLLGGRWLRRRRR